MLMKLPEGITGVGFDGEEYFPDEYGLVDVPERAREELERHGLVLAGPLEGPGAPLKPQEKADRTPWHKDKKGEKDKPNKGKR